MIIYLSKLVSDKYKFSTNYRKRCCDRTKKIQTVTSYIIPLSLINIPTLPLNAQTQPTETQENQPIEAPSPEDIASQPKQSDRINYFGIGGAIGLEDAGETALGDGGLAILGRVSVTNFFSIHSSSIISGDNLISIAATGGIPIKYKETGRTIVFPFVGGGISADTKDFNVDPVVTGGVDIPINQLITGTMRVNANFGERPRVADTKRVRHAGVSPACAIT